MSLRLYNTLTRTKEEFKPLDPQNVRMYVCGPTVYDFAHIGNARPVIVFDVLFRLLRHLYGPDHVTYVRNITDVDDKINARALRDFPKLPLNEAIRNVTETTANQFFADVAALGCLEPTEQPRATDNIAQMIEMIAELISRGHAYVAEGEVLFSVPSMPDYGALSQRNLDDQQAGARIAVEAHKKNPADFVLWKLSSAEEPGWDSPWGRGRPGWHIECSAMSKRYLGEVFDIHGGGLDLIFPHHENEIAQSRCAHGTDVMAKVWMHNGFLQVEGQKMSKSLGNFVTINELLNNSRLGPLPGVLLRLVMMGTHYRDPIDWTYSKVREARSKLSLWNMAIGNQWEQLGESLDYSDIWLNLKPPSSPLLEALLDDLNTPLVISRLSEMYPASDLRVGKGVLELLSDLSFLGLANRQSLYFGQGVVGLEWPNTIADQIIDLGSNYRVAVANGNISAATSIISSLEALGCVLKDDSFLDVSIDFQAQNSDHKTIDDLIRERETARKSKNWAESDRIRDELAKLGIAIKDNKDGTTSWEVKR